MSDTASRKRSVSAATPDSDPKRPRLASRDGQEQQPGTNQAEIQQDALSEWADEESISAVASMSPTVHQFARTGIQRSIAMVLSHDGFESASPEAMESFTELVEQYMSSIIQEVKRLAISSRREAPIPSDFESMLKHHNIPLSSLKPHVKSKIFNQNATDRGLAVVTADDTFTSLPLLGVELSGQPDKDSKPYIPASFPGFPSTHTYRFTPQEDKRTKDSKQIREDAAKSAQLGEDALRRLVRASKMRKQKEVKSLVERDSQGKERFRLWESTMKRFMGGDRFREHADKVDIADHSMLVNADVKFSRREVSRLGKKSNAL
ncbi:Bromodomain transcription factor [Trichoderma guizhouense]|uniref:Transcription initiation factor TFIID subunit 8 n=1 Tax=Trichoderma guizhouense TaxID=1491466 RepID=A0A1T3C4W1_9HYPO|nr:Bromodomain transcription factor [Trichoderma guizhouense]